MLNTESIYLARTAQVKRNTKLTLDTKRVGEDGSINDVTEGCSQQFVSLLMNAEYSVN